MLSAGGTGIPVYRRLQRAGVPFAAGVLYENDVDLPLARRLAVETVTEAPFMPISDEAMARTRALMRASGRLIDAGVPITDLNRRLNELIDEAKRLNIYEEARNT